jgi:hypothetical protein
MTEPEWIDLCERMAALGSREDWTDAKGAELARVLKYVPGQEAHDALTRLVATRNFRPAPAEILEEIVRARRPVHSTAWAVSWCSRTVAGDASTGAQQHPVLHYFAGRWGGFPAIKALLADSETYFYRQSPVYYEQAVKDWLDEERRRLLLPPAEREETPVPAIAPEERRVEYARAPEGYGKEDGDAAAGA